MRILDKDKSSSVSIIKRYLPCLFCTSSKVSTFVSIVSLISGLITTVLIDCNKYIIKRIEI